MSLTLAASFLMCDSFRWLSVYIYKGMKLIFGIMLHKCGDNLLMILVNMLRFCPDLTPRLFCSQHEISEFSKKLRGPPWDNFRPNRNLPSYSLAEDIMPRQVKTHHWFWKNIMSSAREYQGRLRFSRKLSHGAPLNIFFGREITCFLPKSLLIPYSNNNKIWVIWSFWMQKPAFGTG